MTQQFDQQDIAKAWTLWNSLHAYASVLWEKYEQPFSQILANQEEPSNDYIVTDFMADDIPF